MTFAKSPKSKFTPEVDETTHSEGYMHRLQHGLGLWGLIIIGGGTAVILAVLGFLVFLWSGEGPEDGRHATKAWRWVILNQHITQAVTLSTVLLRVAVTTQSSIYTSLVASLVLEGHGVPLHRAAEVSVIRCANDGPLGLSWLLLTSVRRSAAQAALAVVLLVATVAVQFSSTLLVSDLELTPLVDEQLGAAAYGLRALWRNTSEVQEEMLGTGAANKTTASRGIFSVSLLQNPAHLNATQFLTNKLINDLYNSPRPNVSIFLDPLSSGISNVKSHMEYQAIFTDALAATGRPGAAMQAVLTVLAGSAINEGLPQFDVSGDAVLTASVGVPAPRRMWGLVGILGVVAVHAACGLAAVLMFAPRCRYSSRGNYWQGLAQVVSDETAWVLEGASRSADSHVKREIGGGGPVVRVARSDVSGRVRIVACDGGV
ncbi:hypothetical protein CSOJ01_12310 [Colletotrichum sojae]|uniref:Uncharacterized protein n=1 Tax=Colletotrichum sojae TaxID=2175907 RepID=A0A8H6IV54_9PEZI|nr:hypothetical protein CSOJ01_12310 [Colletotrichum sojae]